MLSVLLVSRWEGRVVGVVTLVSFSIAALCLRYAAAWNRVLNFCFAQELLFVSVLGIFFALVIELCTTIVAITTKRN